MLADGTIEFLGRKDQQVKLRGYRVELSEIDNVLESFGEVVRAVTIVDKSQMLHSFVIPNLAHIEQEFLKEKISSQLPSYMLPETIHIVENMSTLPNGKVDRELLKKIANTKSNKDRYVPADSQLEQALVDIWRKVLKVDQVGVTDKFFAIGGDSIRSIQIIYEAKCLNMHFTVMDIFEHQTIRNLAGFLRESSCENTYVRAVAHDNPAPTVLTDRYEDAYPATKIQKYMIKKYAEDLHRMGIFHVQQMFKVNMPDFSIDHFIDALKTSTVSANYRTGFVVENDEIYQVLINDRSPIIEVIDIRHYNSDDKDKKIRNIIENDRNNAFDPFDLTQPLTRFYLFLKQENVFELLCVNHHTVQDGWGTVEFFNRFAEYYKLKNATQDNVLSRSTVNDCKTYALQQYELLSDKEQIEFWQSEAEWFNTLDRPEYNFTSLDRYETLSEIIDAAIGETLNVWCRERNLTIKSVLLTVYLQALNLLGQSTLVGVISNGRNQGLSDPLNTTGLFWNLMPFSIPIDSNRYDEKLSVDVQNKLIKMEKYSYFPFTEIQKISGKKDLFIATYNFINFHNARNKQEYGIGSVEITHSLDNLGFPIGFTIGNNLDRSIHFSLSLNSLLPFSVNDFKDCFLMILKDLTNNEENKV